MIYIYHIIFDLLSKICMRFAGITHTSAGDTLYTIDARDALFILLVYRWR